MANICFLLQLRYRLLIIFIREFVYTVRNDYQSSSLSSELFCLSFFEGLLVRQYH